MNKTLLNSKQARPSIVLESTLTRAMYARVLFLLAARSWGFWLLVAGLGFVIWASVTTGKYVFLLIYAALFVVVYVAPVLFSVLARRSRSAYIKVRYTFDGSGVTKQTGQTVQKLHWNAFIRWKKVGSYYLIYQSRRSFFVIPQVRVADNLSSFESLLKQNVLRRRVGLPVR